METVSRKNVNFQDNLQKSIWLKYWQGEDILIICQLFRFCIEQGAGGSSSKYSPPVSVINLSICQQWSLFTVNINVRIANIWRKVEKEKVLGKGKWEEMWVGGKARLRGSQVSDPGQIHRHRNQPGRYLHSSFSSNSLLFMNKGDILYKVWCQDWFFCIWQCAVLSLTNRFSIFVEITPYLLYNYALIYWRDVCSGKSKFMDIFLSQGLET